MCGVVGLMCFASLAFVVIDFMLTITIEVYNCSYRPQLFMHKYRDELFLSQNRNHFSSLVCFCFSTIVSGLKQNDIFSIYFSEGILAHKDPSE